MCQTYFSIKSEEVKVSKRSFNSGAMRVLKVGEFDLVTPGHDKPGKGFPSKCAHCLKPIQVGEIWRDHFNGQYHILYHTACEVQGNGG